MHKKIVLLLIFIVSFVVSIDSVKADYNKIECVYKANLYNGKSWVVGIVRDSDGKVHGYKAVYPISDYNKDLFSNNDDDYWGSVPFVLTKKMSDKEKLENSSTSLAVEMNKNNKCPNYIDLDVYNNESFPSIFATYDNKKNGKPWSNYSELEKQIDGSNYGNNDINDSNNDYKEFECVYPATSQTGKKFVSQKEIVINQSKLGTIEVLYDGKKLNATFRNDTNDFTGYNNKGYFDECPPCANKVASAPIIEFRNYNSTGGCDSNFSSWKSNNSNYTHSCKYALLDDISVQVTLSFNKENFEISSTTPNVYYDFNVNQMLKVSKDGTKCPRNLYSKIKKNPTGIAIMNETFYLSDKGDRIYALIDDGEPVEPNPVEPPVNPVDCNDLLEDAIEIIQMIMNYLRIIIPILLLIYGTTDFFKAIFGTSTDNMKDDRTRFFKRVAAAVIAFIVPTFVTLALKLAQQVWPEINSETCISEKKEGGS